MATDLYSTVLYNDGEGLDYTDLNAMSQGMVARIAEQMWGRMCGYLGVTNKDPQLQGEGGDDAALTSLAYTLTGGDCVAAQGSSTTKLKLLGGTIFQKIAAADGAEASFIPFTLRAGDVDLTITAGDATNPRIDILQMKLEWVDGDAEDRDFKDGTTGAVTTTSTDKTRRVQATFSMKNGTAAATPTYPAPDTGYCLVAAVRVPSTWTANVGPETGGSSSAITRQCTIPLKIEHHQSFPHEWDDTLATNWVRNASGCWSASGGDATNLIVPVPQGALEKRIVAIGITAVWVTSGLVELKTITWNQISGYSTSQHAAFDLSSSLVTTGGTHRQQMVHLGDICDASTLSNPSAAAGVIGDPYWCGGGISGPSRRSVERNNEGAGSDWPSRAMLLIDAGSGSDIISVDWYIAG